MRNIVIDTNPLVYIYHAIPHLGKAYAVLFENLSRRNTLTIPEIVYGELSLIFVDTDELNHFVRDTGIVVGKTEPETYVIAAKRWEIYNRRRTLMCATCGERYGKLTCRKCTSEIRIRQHILSDFLIGAYALQMEGSLVTNDSGYYSTYFSELKIINVWTETPVQKN
jgi:predicted nucleic acid-binding protein